MHSKEDFLVYCCRICGFDYDAIGTDPEEFPWGEYGKTPSFDICVCCGHELGFHDDIRACGKPIQTYRLKWIQEGMTFYLPQYKPVCWNPEEQLENIPEEFR